ncbi:MAG: DUF5131 family protein [Candidatus Methylomirabilales bacterium]|nr:DUF5131 family protein [candidate division NC10 bacterium]
MTLYETPYDLAYIQQVFAIMERTPWHTYQILTKRSERMAFVAPLLSWKGGKGDKSH